MSASFKWLYLFHHWQPYISRVVCDLPLSIHCNYHSAICIFYLAHHTSDSSPRSQYSFLIGFVCSRWISPKVSGTPSETTSDCHLAPLLFVKAYLFPSPSICIFTYRPQAHWVASETQGSPMLPFAEKLWVFHFHYKEEATNFPYFGI